jgi:hypothetical protein
MLLYLLSPFVLEELQMTLSFSLVIKDFLGVGVAPEKLDWSIKSGDF